MFHKSRSATPAQKNRAPKAVPNLVPLNSHLSRQLKNGARSTSLPSISPHLTAISPRLPVGQAVAPIWLKLLVQAQRASVGVTFILVMIALAVYGNTAYIQRLLSKGYSELQTAQRNERQLIATSEILKNQIAEQAEAPGSGLTPQTLKSTIFLQPAPPRKPIQPEAKSRPLLIPSTQALMPPAVKTVPANSDPAPAPLGY